MQDDFNLEDFENKEETEITAKDRFNNVLAYVPFLNLWLLYTQNVSTKKFAKRYLSQWITLFLMYIVLFLITSFIFIKLSFLITVLYLCVVVFFAAKAYNWMYVEIEIIEKIIEQFNPNKQKK